MGVDLKYNILQHLLWQYKNKLQENIQKTKMKYGDSIKQLCIEMSSCGQNMIANLTSTVHRQDAKVLAFSVFIEPDMMFVRS